jgi:hypothetical protein
MSPTTISTNGHDRPPPERSPGPIARRRPSAARGLDSPEALIEGQLENARRQLDEARETLKSSRRRVVQLEDVVTSLEHFAAVLRQNGGGRAPSA